MSVSIPKAAVVFGSVTPPQGDIIDLNVHLGCTKEVSSFSCLLQNWDKKYSPGGTSPISVGMDGHIDIGRGTNVPQIITCRIEKVQCESPTPNEHYIRVSGRGWGERIFRRVVTKVYENKKGEEIVKDIIDYYVGLSHVRESTELIEDTDTTYTYLQYENTPVFDILKYIAESSDKAGVIGYDFRVAPDGKFEFFPKNSKFWVDEGLVLYFPFDEAEGTVAYDKSNKNNNGTLKPDPPNGPTWVDGKHGKALSFDGGDDHVEVADNSSLRIEKWSIVAWIKVNSIISNDIILRKMKDATYVNYCLYVQNGYLVGDFYVGSTLHQVKDDANQLTVGPWHHVAFTYDKETMRLWKNGVNIKSKADTATPDTTGGNLELGRYKLGIEYPFDGIMDEVRIYNRALTPEEIKDHFLCGPPPLSQKIEVSEYRKDIHRVRNKIMIYGLADKSVPADKDAWTESLTPDDGSWSAAAGEVSLDTDFKAKGSASIKVHSVTMYWVGAIFTLNAGEEVDANKYPLLSFLAYLEKSYNGNVSIMLYDQTDKTASKNITIAPGKWRKTDVKTGLANEMEWTDVDAGFDWSNIKKVRIDGWFSGVGSGDFWIDQLYFGGRRYSATREDVTSQSNYGLRELVEVDEELVSDNECDLRAKALLDYFKNAAEYLKISTTVLDYGNTPLLPADKIPVILPNENVDSDFRIESVEYSVDAKTQTLELVLELGKVPPFLADYLYGMRATTVTVEKLARTKLGKGAIPTALGGGLGAHHVGHEAGDDNGVPWASEDDGGWDKITGWICPKHIGPNEDAASIIKFRTKNKAGTGVLDHQFQPSDDEHGVLGSATAKWKEVHTLYLLLYTDGYMQIKTYGESNPKAKLDKEMLQFGPGGATALDTWLKRVGAGQLELKTELQPVSDNSGKIGTSAKRFAEINGYQYGISGNMLPASDNASNLGAADKRFAHIYAVEIHVSSMLFNFNLLPDATNTYDLGSSLKKWKDLYLSGAIKALDAGVAVHLLPNATATYDLGSATKKWSNLYVNGVGDLGSLNVGGYAVITAARVLQNVTADVAIITSGRFPLARLAEGTSGYVLEAQGAGFDPMYVNPNYRYEPASHAHSEHTGIGPNDHHAQVHDHATETISPATVNCNAISIAGSCNRQYSHPSSQQCVYATSVAWEYCPHYACVNYSAGDLCIKKGMRIPFINGMAITEAESLGLGPGFAFLNRKGKVIMVLDEDGNIEISGKIKEGVAA